MSKHTSLTRLITISNNNNINIIQERVCKESPKVQLTIENEEYEFMHDTGAQFSYLPTKTIIEKFYSKSYKKEIEHVLADDTIITTTIATTLNVRINSYEQITNCEFLGLDTTKKYGIIGMGLLNNLDACINIKEETLKINGKQVSFSNKGVN